MGNVFPFIGNMCQKAMVVGGLGGEERRGNNQWIGIWKEREDLKFYLPLSTRYSRDPEELTPVRILTLFFGFCRFPRIPGASSKVSGV